MACSLRESQICGGPGLREGRCKSRPQPPGPTHIGAKNTYVGGSIRRNFIGLWFEATRIGHRLLRHLGQRTFRYSVAHDVPLLRSRQQHDAVKRRTPRQLLGSHWLGAAFPSTAVVRVQRSSSAPGLVSYFTRCVVIRASEHGRAWQSPTARFLWHGIGVLIR